MALSPERIRELRIKAGVSPEIPVSSASKTSPEVIAERLRRFDAATASPSSMPKEKSTFGKISETLGDFSEGVAKGGLSTFKGLSQIGERIGRTALGAVEKVTGLPVTPEETWSEEALQKNKEQGGFTGKLFNEENLTPTNTAQSIGKGTEQIAEFFIPASKINAVEKILAGGMKTATIAKLTPIIGEKAANTVAKLASGGTKMAVRAGEGGGIISLQTGGDAEAVKSGTITGAAFPPVIAVAKPILKVAGNFVKGASTRLAGALAGGRGTSVIDEIVKDPKSALEGLSGKSIDTLSKDARLLKETQVNAKKAAGEEFNRVLNNLQEIYVNEGKSFDKGTEINKITDLLENKFGIVKSGKIADLAGEVAEDAGKLNFEGSRFINPGDVGIINRAMNAVKNFRGPWDPKGIESLASKIDKLKGSDAELNSAIHTFTASLRDSVAKMGEEAGYVEGANLARNFAQAMDEIDTFQKMFKSSADDLRTSIGADKSGQVILTEAEKLNIVNDLSTIFSGNKDFDKAKLRKVFGGQELLSRQAGRTLATTTEKASGGIADTFRQVVVAPIASPATIGKIAAYTKLTADQVSKFVKYLKKLDPVKRGAIIELFSQKHE